MLIALQIPVEVVNYGYNIFPNNSYNYLYELSDGQKKEEHGYFTLDPSGNQVLNVFGFYRYFLDNKEYKVEYTSDTNGYHASGDHIPDTGTEAEEFEIGDRLGANVIKTLVG